VLSEISTLSIAIIQRHVADKKEAARADDGRLRRRPNRP
jgi:hypothetical protein